MSACALLNPSRLGPRVKRELREAIGLHWPVEFIRAGGINGQDAKNRRQPR
jgi:hypothetical protein